MIPAIQLFYHAYRDAGLVQLAGTVLNPDQAEEARQLYNRMIDAWRADGATVSHVQRRLFPITASKADYTLGPGGDWDAVWQERVDRAGIVLNSQSGVPEYDLWPLTIDEWKSWTYKNTESNFPNRYFYERDWPLGIVHLLYVPSEANSAVLYLEDPLGRIEDLDGEIDFQPAYEDAVTSNLAVRLAAAHPNEANLAQSTIQLATSSLALVKTVNNRPLKRTSDYQLKSHGRSNIYQGNRYQ